MVTIAGIGEIHGAVRTIMAAGIAGRMVIMLAILIVIMAGLMDMVVAMVAMVVIMVMVMEITMAMAITGIRGAVVIM